MNNTTDSESNNQDREPNEREPSGQTTEPELTEVDSTEPNSTGLPWPKTWKGAYMLVLANFALWLAMLLALQEFCK
jgi:hypothetical protein